MEKLAQCLGLQRCLFLPPPWTLPGCTIPNHPQPSPTAFPQVAPGSAGILINASFLRKLILVQTSSQKPLLNLREQSCLAALA